MKITSVPDIGTPRFLVLSNVHDDQYHDVRGEEIKRSLSGAKRRDLFRCLEMATGRELIVLSSPPKAANHKRSRWLPAVETRFSTHRQFFCANWDTPKFRIPFSWLFYARHVLGHARDGDLLLIDNYEIIYVIAVLLTRCFRKVTILLDYEDGKHLIDKGWTKILSSLAETLGRPLIRGALVAHPALARRLPTSLPTELVPGFVVSRNRFSPLPESGSLEAAASVRFLYSGSLDKPRGVDLLLRAIDLLPEKGWHLDITGFGTYESELAHLATSAKYGDRVTFHGSLDQSSYDFLIAQCHVGLNCQRPDNPISDVTFPSKIFSYLSAGLKVLSSKASDVPRICGPALLYVEEETAEALATAMKAIIDDPAGELGRANTIDACHYFSVEQTALRLQAFFKKITAL